MKIFHLDLSVFFSSFDKIFHLACFVFDFDDFYFWAYGEMGDAFHWAFLGFQQQIQKIDREPNILLYSNFENYKKGKSEEHFPSGHKYVTK